MNTRLMLFSPRPHSAGKSRRSLHALGAALCLAALVATPVAMGQQDPTITRSIPSSITRGDSIRVTLDAELNGATGPWRVSEQVPDGFTVEDISHDGRFVPASRQVEWGPFTHTDDTSMSFRLVPTQLGLGNSVVQIGGPETGLFANTESTPFPISGPDQIDVRDRARARDPVATRTLPDNLKLGQPFVATIRARPGTSNPWGVTEQVPFGFDVQDISHGGRFSPGTRRIHWGMFPDAEERELSFRLVPSQLNLGSSVVEVGGPEAVLFDDPVLAPVEISGPDEISLSGPVFPRDPSSEPAIVTQPVSQSVKEGRTATFSVAVTGREPLSFQWFHNGEPIPGAVSQSRIFRDVSRADEGMVFVVVTDAKNRQSVSQPALLHIATSDDPPTGPVITKQPRDQAVNIENTTAFSISATGSSPSFQWFHNGFPIAGETSEKLVISDVSRNDEGVFHATVTDADGNTTVSNAAVLEVIIPDTFSVSRAEEENLPKLFNLAGSYTDRFHFDGAETTVEYSLSHNQYGRLTGNGNLSFSSPDGDFSTDTLQVHGNIRRIGHPDNPINRVNLILRASQESSFDIVVNQVMEITGHDDLIIGHVRGRARVGENHYTIEEEGHQTALPAERDGSWTLTITPPVKDEIDGEAILHIQGDELSYNVERLHLFVQDIEIYHLRGVGMDSRGSNLRVDFDPADRVKRIFGQAKGQRLAPTPDD